MFDTTGVAAALVAGGALGALVLFGWIVVRSRSMTRSQSRRTVRVILAWVFGSALLITAGVLLATR